MFSKDSIVSDIVATTLTYAISESVYKLLTKVHDKGFIDVSLYRKIVRMTTGPVPMLCRPMFSSGWLGDILAALVPYFLIMKEVIIGIVKQTNAKYIKNENHGRYQDQRELFLAAFWYLSTMAFATVLYWRTPIAIAAMCNLCAGDGMAEIAGTRFGRRKLPYNREKTYVGSIAMATAGFLASIGYIYYFSWLVYMKESLSMVLGFLMVPALVESHPLSSKLEDNLTVPLTAMFVGSYVL